MGNRKAATAGHFKSIVDALPLLVFLVDEDVRIHEYNEAAADFMASPRRAILKQRGGDVFQCIHSADVPDGCGRGPFCKNCCIRKSVAEAFQGIHIERRRMRIQVVRDGETVDVFSMITVSPFHYEGNLLALLTIEEISEIGEIRRLLSICSACKKVRSGEQTWLSLEGYFKERWNIDFSHGLCPDCYEIQKAAWGDLGLRETEESSED